MDRRPTLILLCVALAAAAPGCGDDDRTDAPSAPSAADVIERDAANAETEIVVGSKDFTEQKVLGEIYAQGLEAAGYEVRKQLNLGDEKTAQRALKQGDIDGYPEYTGTALLSLCEVPTAEVPKDPQGAFAKAQACFERDGLTAFPPTPFTSSNEVGVKRAVASRYGLTRISDLAKVDQDFTLYGTRECRQRADCLRGLRQTYRLAFRRFTPVDIDLRHEVLGRGEQVASIVFTTDPQNKRENIVLLEDDRGMFPPYNSTFVVRDEVAEQAGEDLPRVLEQIQAGLTDEVMQELNARVDLDGQTPEEVAQAYLQESGLIAS